MLDLGEVVGVLPDSQEVDVFDLLGAVAIPRLRRGMTEPSLRVRCPCPGLAVVEARAPLLSILRRVDERASQSPNRWRAFGMGSVTPDGSCAGDPSRWSALTNRPGQVVVAACGIHEV
jgi:hypothetical protein